MLNTKKIITYCNKFNLKQQIVLRRQNNERNNESADNTAQYTKV